MSLDTALTLATVFRTIGFVLATIVLVGFLAYVLVNVLYSAKPEVGAELELAANRKPYYDDEQLEGPKLERALTISLLTLFVLAVGIPLYWILEPGRQEGAADNFLDQFVARGEAMYAATGDNAQALNCAGCHGGFEGGIVEFNRTDPATGLIERVDWRAPSLGDVLLRFSREEVEFILVYGRPGTPMPAWGVEGGGPLNEQQVQNIIDYLDVNTFDPADSRAELEQRLETYTEAVFEDGTRVFGSDGEALFNMGLLDNWRGGAYSCARCHTAGWSYAEVETEAATDTSPMVVNREQFEAATANSGCGGAFGFNLCDGATERQFPAEEDPADGESAFQDMIEFIANGSVAGEGYGVQGQGSGKMPGFGVRPGEPGLYWLNRGEERAPAEGMLTPEQIEAIVLYERGLVSAEGTATEDASQ